MSRLLLASRNAKKLAELRRVVAAAGLTGVEVVGLDDVPPFPEEPETGATFEENALIKARAGARSTGLPCVADDSGLAVDALNGMPGVLSARWSGRHGDDEANNALLLAQNIVGEGARIAVIQIEIGAGHRRIKPFSMQIGNLNLRTLLA